ncbi:hypothetical protein V6C03_10630 [Methyloligella sp. 2.7D]|uniref:hypothetical protein n=1 Tax=unclassified Methyloligella TaxID=2625955 RepID=UPI00157C1199|nr:hypothetical protein [Methyloligella sp. GL2]QKP77719.1 hypothetical protein HT051_09830 [Methyloligella sp. GL2]
MRWLFILLIPLALGGCVTEQQPALPMALGPSESAEGTCLRYGDAPAFGDCGDEAVVSVTPAQ